MRSRQSLVVNNTIDMWNCEKQLKEIRGIISSTPLTDVEFACLVQLGKATQLNPFMREIWAVKYTQGKAASIFIGRDGYRKAAQRDRDYEYHQVNAVYSKDEFKICNDEITHTYGFSNRGDLVGAYCIVKRKSSAKPTYVLVTMDEYNQRQSLWKDKPETMIKKVAEAQALRQAFQDLLAGTYSDAELPPEPPKLTIVNKPEGATHTERLKNLLNLRDQELDIPEYRIITSTQFGTIMELLGLIGLPPERLQKALANYDASSIEALTEEQAEDFITNLRKLYDKQSIVAGSRGES
jgi:phage recombination protein Bet